MIAENRLTYLSTDSAIPVYNLTDIIKGDYSLSHRNERVVKSIDANISTVRFSNSFPRFS